MRLFPAVLGVALLLAQVQLFAQNTQKSGQNPPASSSSSASTTSPGVAAAEDFSGMYTFLHDGEFLQLTVEPDGTVTGFISRFGELDSDKGAFLNQFFKKAKLEGDKLEFTTQTVHGAWFEFKGVAGHGPDKKLGDEGYYQLKGKLTENTTGANNKAVTKVRQVVFQSFPPDVEDSPLTNP